MFCQEANRIYLFEKGPIKVNYVNYLHIEYKISLKLFVTRGYAETSETRPGSTKNGIEVKVKQKIPLLPE